MDLLLSRRCVVKMSYIKINHADFYFPQEYTAGCLDLFIYIFIYLFILTSNLCCCEQLSKFLPCHGNYLAIFALFCMLGREMSRACQKRVLSSVTMLSCNFRDL